MEDAALAGLRKADEGVLPGTVTLLRIIPFREGREQILRHFETSKPSLP